MRRTFIPHFEYVFNRSIAVLKFVKRQSYYFSKETIRILYQALVRSILEFSSTVWSPYVGVHKCRLESVQKQLVLFLLGDDKRHLTEEYVLPPYTERCNQLEMVTLVRRRINAIILFIHSLIMGKFNSPHLRSLITLNKSSRSMRFFNFITIKGYNREYLTSSPFNKACSLFNIAARQIDPLLPRRHFRSALMNIPDNVFGHWTEL